MRLFLRCVIGFRFDGIYYDDCIVYVIIECAFCRKDGLGTANPSLRRPYRYLKYLIKYLTLFNYYGGRQERKS